MKKWMYWLGEAAVFELSKFIAAPVKRQEKKNCHSYDFKIV